MFRGLARQMGAWGAIAEARLASSGTQLLEGSSSTAAAAPRWLRPAATTWCQQQSAGYSTDEFRKVIHTAAPRSLHFQRQPAEELAAEAQRGFAVKALLTLGGYYSRESRHLRAAQRLYTAVAEQAAAPEFLQAMGIPEDFQQTHSSLCLHIWLLLVRLRPEGKDGKQLAQMLYDDFQTDVEDRARKGGVRVRLRPEGKDGKQLAQMLYDDFQTDVEDRARKGGVRVRLQKTLTELEKQFYGSSMAYDKAMAGGEPLEKALLRNVYLLDESKATDAKMLAHYVRRELACLSLTPSDAVMSGNLKFSSEGMQPEAAAGEEAAAAAAAAAGPDGKQAAPTAGSAA